jgi:hypothetical protein|nr:hypothetical protein [uncultured Flavobacterium sp.]
MTLYKNEIDRAIESLNKTILPAKRNDIPKDYYNKTSYLIIIDTIK